jgi:AcrR family transcriptional regulator
MHVDLPEARLRAISQRHEVANARQRLLDEAFVQFYNPGIRAAGIDLIIQRSGVAKATFYRHFPSKTTLVVAYVKRRNAAFLEWLAELVEEQVDDPGARLLAIFDALAELFADPGFNGCPINNAVAEVGRQSPDVLAEAVAAKAALIAYVRGLAEAAGVPQPDDLARQWALLVDGAFVAAQRSHGPDPAAWARTAAAQILEATRP